MSNKARSLFMHNWSLLAISALAPTLLSAQGNGGYRAVATDCVVVVVPVNAYYVDDSYAAGWSCNRGYVDRGKACVPVALPANAHLN